MTLAGLEQCLRNSAYILQNYIRDLLYIYINEHRTALRQVQLGHMNLNYSSINRPYLRGTVGSRTIVARWIEPVKENSPTWSIHTWSVEYIMHIDNIVQSANINENAIVEVYNMLACLWFNHIVFIYLAFFLQPADITACSLLAQKYIRSRNAISIIEEH